MLGGLEGGQVAFVDSAAMDEQCLARNRIGHSAVVDVLETDVGNLGRECLKGREQQRAKDKRVVARAAVCSGIYTLPVKKAR